MAGEDGGVPLVPTGGPDKFAGYNRAIADDEEQDERERAVARLVGVVFMEQCLGEAHTPAALLTKITCTLPRCSKLASYTAPKGVLDELPMEEDEEDAVSEPSPSAFTPLHTSELACLHLCNTRASHGSFTCRAASSLGCCTSTNLHPIDAASPPEHSPQN